MKYGGRMNELPYPSDLPAAQWALIERLLPAPKPKGRKQRVDLRKITNAILYVLKGGISWRMLPREFAPWKTVYHYFRLWRLAGLWDRIHDQLRDQVRVSKGRHICPSAAIVDSQSVATQQKGAIGATMLRSAFDCLHSSAVLSSAFRLLCYVGYNGSFQAGSKPPEVAASWTAWNVRTATPSTLRRTHQRAKGALTGCI